MADGCDVGKAVDGTTVGISVGLAVGTSVGAFEMDARDMPHNSVSVEVATYTLNGSIPVVTYTALLTAALVDG